MGYNREETRRFINLQSDFRKRFHERCADRCCVNCKYGVDELEGVASCIHPARGYTLERQDYFLCNTMACRVCDAWERDASEGK